MSINIGNTEVLNIYIGDTPATAVYIGDTQIWGGGGKDYSKEYFTIEMLSAGTISWSVSNVYYSVDDGNTWSSWSGSYVANQGDKILLKSSRTGNFSKQNITSTGEFIAYGNVMSLYYGDNFQSATTVSIVSAFERLFRYNTKITNAENLIIPLSELSKGYELAEMFNGCSNLVKAPSLPTATALNTASYQSMFKNCTSLTSVPTILPATTLSDNCYSSMFSGCISLTEAPELPATTLVSYCYSYMFYGCTNLNYIKCLATSIANTGCVQNWVGGVQTNSGTFIKDATMTGWGTGDNGIPNGWTVESI